MAQSKLHQESTKENNKEWLKIDQDECTAHCIYCMAKQNGLSLSTPTRLHLFATSVIKINQHKKKKKHTDAEKEYKRLTDPNDTSKINVFNKKMEEKKENKKEDEFQTMIKPLVALAFWITNNLVAIRKYVSMRDELLPVIIDEMIKLFKEAVDDDIFKEFNRMRNKWETKLRKFERESKMENKVQIGLIREFLSDMKKSNESLRALVEQEAAPRISGYLKTQNDFTDLIRCIAAVKREITAEELQQSPVHSIEADEST